MKNYKILGLVGLAAIAAGSQAAMFSISGMSSGKFQTANITYNSHSFNVYAGAVVGHLDGGAGFDAYCVDLDHWDSIPDHYQVNLRSMADQGPHGTQAAWLFQTYANSVNSTTKGAALQLAIWDVIADGGNGLNHGIFKANVSNQVRDLANQYIAASNSKSASAIWLQAVDHGRHGDQNQNFMMTPEPSAWAAMAIGAAALLKKRIKKS